MPEVAGRPGSFTLGDLIARNAACHGERAAFAFGESRLSHRDFAARVGRLPAGLRHAGLVHGDRIAIVSKNRIEFVELMAAAAALGVAVCPLNWRLAPAEVAKLLDDVTPRFVFVEAEFLPLVEGEAAGASAAERVVLGAGGEGRRSLGDVVEAASTAPGSNGGPEASPVDDDAVLLLLHTASTDGRPKAAMLSHRNLLANALQMRAAWGLHPGDAYLCCVPLFHITALTLLFSTQLAGGSSVITPGFDAAEAAGRIERHRVTLLAEFAPMLAGLLDAALARPGQLGSLRHVCGLDTPATIDRLHASWPEAGFWAGYGQTESTGLVSLGPWRESPGSAGRPLPLVAIAIVGDDDRPVAAGAIGEIVLRGPTVFGGYRGREAENEQALRGGWLHTGDSGRLDAEGRLWFSGRLPAKALIKTGGENVYPAEVEAVLRQHPALLEAAVIGVADATWGESIKAVCVARAGEAPSEAEVIEFVGSRIARYKRPRFVVFVEALPKKADGSIDREAVGALQ